MSDIIGHYNKAMVAVDFHIDEPIHGGQGHIVGNATIQSCGRSCSAWAGSDFFDVLKQCNTALDWSDIVAGKVTHAQLTQLIRALMERDTNQFHVYVNLQEIKDLGDVILMCNLALKDTFHAAMSEFYPVQKQCDHARRVAAIRIGTQGQEDRIAWSEANDIEKELKNQLGDHVGYTRTCSWGSRLHPWAMQEAYHFMMFSQQPLPVMGEDDALVGPTTGGSEPGQPGSIAKSIEPWIFGCQLFRYNIQFVEAEYKVEHATVVHVGAIHKNLKDAREEMNALWASWESGTTSH